MMVISMKTMVTEMMILGVMMLIIICASAICLKADRQAIQVNTFCSELPPIFFCSELPPIFVVQNCHPYLLFINATYTKLQNFMDFVYLAENGRSIFYGNKFSKSVISQYYQTCFTKMAQLKMRQNIHNLKKIVFSVTVPVVLLLLPTILFQLVSWHC